MTFNIGDVVRIALTGSSPQASVFQNVWHLEMVSGAGGAESGLLPAVASSYGTAWAFMNSLVHNSYSWDSLESWAYNFVTHKWEGNDTVVLTSLTGLSSVDPVAHGVAAVGRYVTDVARRQGRHFFPGIIETAVDLGLLDSAFLTAFTSYMTQWVADISYTGATFKLCTFNLDTTSPYYETSSLFEGTILISNIAGYQRRRKPLVGI